MLLLQNVIISKPSSAQTFFEANIMDQSQRNKDAVTQKILATTRETERLKQELEALIEQGIRGRGSVIESPPRPTQLSSTNHVQIIKSYDPKHSQHTKPSKDEARALSPKKPKTYDVKGARDYIKLQRSKRIEDLKSKKSSTQVAADIRKEKLQELQQKANQIVKKNVEAKRARSKSREPPTVRSRSVSRKHRQVAPPRSRSQDQSVIESFNCAQRTSKLENKDHFMKVNFAGNCHNDPNNKSSNLLYPPETEYGLRQLKPIDLNVENHQIISDIAHNLEVPQSSHIASYAEPLKKEKKRNSSSKTSCSLHSTSNTQKLLHPDNINKDYLTVHPNITLRNASEPVSPTISEGVKRIPDWLKEQPQADPYNFINTVKRQLNYAVSQKKPSSVDVGVQGNLDDLISPPHSGKTDLKSFISHKCLNLDPKAIQHIELSRDKKISMFKDGPTITKLSSCSENESNTSKNIPSISSESGTSLRRNAEFVRQSSNAVSDLKLLENGPPNLDSGPVEDVQLQDTQFRLSRPVSEEVEKIKKQLFKDSSDQYSSDFVNTDLSKKRKSIISFNRGPSGSMAEDIASVIIKSSLQTPSTHSDFSSTDGNKSRNSIISFNSASISPNRVLEDLPTTKGTTKSVSENISTNIANENSVIIKSSLQKPSNHSDVAGTDLSKSRQSILFFNSASVSPNRIFEVIPSPKETSKSVSENISTNIANENSVIIKSSLQKPSNHSDVAGTDLSKSRQSIRSFNSASVSPNRILEVIPNPKETSKSIHETNSQALQQPCTNTTSEEVGKVYGSLFSTLHSSSFDSQDKVYQSTDSQGSKSGNSRTAKTSKSITSETLNRQGSDNVSVQEQPKLYKQIFQKGDGKLDSRSRALSKSEPHIFAKDRSIEDPKLSLNIKRKGRRAGAEDREALMKNITIRSGDVSKENLNNPNEIKVKFEAEIHLLTDFNESIRRFSEIEKAFQSLRTQNNLEPIPTRREVLNRDTQTSKRSKTSTPRTASQVIEEQSTILSEKSLDSIISPNVDSALTTVNFQNSLLDETNSDRTSSVMVFPKLDLDESLASRADVGEENVVLKSIVGMSLRMCDQLIRDEDIRIENWKKVIKIREQTLLDRTKGELAWLEVQKKQLIETGNLAEASLIKKKQRGILLKHQQEKHEMQRLKQLQKQDSHERKALLKKERNHIKKQLLSDAMLSKLKPVSQRERYERRLSGPFKVIQASVHSETSLSKGTPGTDQEIKSITTRTSRTHSVVNILSETSDIFNTDRESLNLTLGGRANINAGAVSNMKKKLLMREHALAKRRKTVEELLQWHKKLLDEEKAIEELENKIGTIVSKIPSENNDKSPKKSSIASSNLSTEETSAASMSKLILGRLQVQATTLTTTPKTATPISSEIAKNIPQEEIHSEDSNRVPSSANYSTDFENETAPKNSDDQSSVSSISQLIEDFSKIEDNILNLMSRRQSPVEDETIPLDEAKSEISSQSIEVASQIEANQLDNSELTQLEEVIIELPSEIQDIVSETALRQDSDSGLIPNNIPDHSTITNNSSIDIPTSDITKEEIENIETIKDQIETSLARSSTLEESNAEQEHEPIAVESAPITSEITKESEETNVEQTLIKEDENLQTQSEEPTDISTSKQYEEIDDFVASNLDQPSTSLQGSASSTLAEQNSISSPSPSRTNNEIQSASPNIVEGRQSFENKTDEEKAASLSSTRGTLRQNEVEDGESNKERRSDNETSSEDSVSTMLSEDRSSSSSSENFNRTFEVESGASKKSNDDSSIIDDPSKKSPQPKSPTDIKKHVQEILNGSSPLARGDKSPRMQDLCLITYDTSPIHSPESGSPLDERKPFSLGSEAEELHRKQLAIEQEIKLLKEQQQKEAATPFYVREIPNKPPPPYTPPSKAKAPKTPSVIPGTKEEIEKITEYSAKIIHKAYLSSNLDNITISDNTLNLIAKNIDKGCFKFVFDLCKEIAKDHYSQFIEEGGPSWLQLDKKLMLAPVKPLDLNGLKKLMSKKLSEIFGLEKREIKKENTIMKWSRKKRDHVDEVLLQEMLAEETSWTNSDRDELVVKDQLTNEIMEMLLKETAQLLKKTMEKKFQNQ